MITVWGIRGRHRGIAVSGAGGKHRAIPDDWRSTACATSPRSSEPVTSGDLASRPQLAWLRTRASGGGTTGNGGAAGGGATGDRSRRELGRYRHGRRADGAPCASGGVTGATTRAEGWAVRGPWRGSPADAPAEVRSRGAGRAAGSKFAGCGAMAGFAAGHVGRRRRPAGAGRATPGTRVLARRLARLTAISAPSWLTAGRSAHMFSPTCHRGTLGEHRSIMPRPCSYIEKVAPRAQAGKVTHAPRAVLGR